MRQLTKNQKLYAKVIGLQLLFLAVMLVLVGKWRPEAGADSQSYVHLSQASFTEVFSSSRTAGYPLLIRALRFLVGGENAIPAFQFLAHGFSTWVFCLGLMAMGFGALHAILGASGLLYATIFLTHVNRLLTDSLGASLAILSAGLFLILWHRPRSRKLWLAFTASVFLDYQVRPAYLYLIAVFPFVALVWMGLARSFDSRMFGKILAACALPFLLFCGFRGVGFGHFGLVSFGGMNLIGIAGQFLTDEQIPSLPEHLRELASVAQRIKRENNVLSPFAHGVFDYHIVASNFNTTTHHVFYPAASLLVGDDQIKINRLLTDMARVLVMRSPGPFAHVVYLNLQMAIGGTLLRNFLFLFGILAAFMAYLFNRGHNPKNNGAALLRLWSLSATYMLAGVAIIATIELPVGRYLDALGIFLTPCALLTAASRWGMPSALRSSATLSAENASPTELSRQSAA